MELSLSKLIGPRIGAAELRRHTTRYMLPTLLFTLAAACLALSAFLPWWRLTLLAPQYPQGLTVSATLTRLDGDVAEIDGLNHYIGMRPLASAAQFERRVALYGVAALVLLVLGAIYVHNRAAAWLTLPAVLFPLIFLGDMAWWLHNFGTHLDPHAPLSQAIKPFVPPVLGPGRVGQFHTVSSIDSGFMLAVLASLLIVVGWWYHRAAYRPLLMLLLLVALTPAHAADLPARLAAAHDGDVVVFHGTWHGPLEVRHRVTLEGAVIDGDGKGTVVRLMAPGAVLSHCTVRGSGDSLNDENSGVTLEAPGCVVRDCRLEDTLFGIYVNRASHCRVERTEICSKPLPVAQRGDAIRVWYSDDVHLCNNRIRQGRDAVLWYSNHLEVAGNDVRDCRYGLHLMYDDDADIHDNILCENSVGIYLMYSRRLHLQRNRLCSNRGPSGYGLGMKDLDDADIHGNLFADNRIGIWVDNSPREVGSRVRYEGNTIAFNDVGLSLMPGVRRNDVNGNNLIENGEAVRIDGGGELQDDVFAGNYWSDYTGYDADRDGTGDVSYRSQRLFEDLLDRHPDLRLFAGSPAAGALDFAARAVPLIAPRTRVEDAAPRMRPVPLADLPQLPPAARDSRPGAMLVFLSALMVAAPVAVRKVASRPRPVETAMVSVEGVGRRFGPFVALQDVSFTAAAGEAVALWGANGAGKTTLLRVMLGLIRSSGRVLVGGLPQGPEARRMIGFVPQEIGFHDDLTVLETLQFYTSLREAPESAGLLHRVGLAEHERKLVRQLSGGLKQRLALAIALIGDPPLLLLDEPTSNLDAAGREDFMRLLLALKANGKTMVFSSHRREEVDALADRVIVLDGGRMVQS